MLIQVKVCKTVLTIHVDVIKSVLVVPVNKWEQVFLSLTACS